MSPNVLQIGEAVFKISSEPICTMSWLIDSLLGTPVRVIHVSSPELEDIPDKLNQQQA